MSKKIGVIQFPGTNCEYDVIKALELSGAIGEIIWHTQKNLFNFDALIIPGGFAHGDYLRPGAIARFSPVMEAVKEFAKQQGPILGICNGFQILTEAHLLPGALQKNVGLKFLCKKAIVEVVTKNSYLTSELKKNYLELPINHFAGSYVCSSSTLKELKDNDQIILRYQNNLNGSLASIAGICNKDRNVIGLMPHPERACNKITGELDGLNLFRSFINQL